MIVIYWMEMASYFMAVYDKCVSFLNLEQVNVGTSKSFFGNCTNQPVEKAKKKSKFLWFCNDKKNYIRGLTTKYYYLSL